MVQVTISALTPSSIPANGWDVRYRIAGTTGGYTTPVSSPFMALPIVFSTTDPGGTLYEVQVARNCGSLESTEFTLITPCNCTDGTYTSTGTYCTKTVSVSPTITESGYCLAASGNSVYSSYGTRIYNVGFSLTDILANPATTGTFIYGYNTTNPQWANTTGSTTLGPMNREGVWIDATCSGNVSPLTMGAQCTIGFLFNNTGVARTVFVGVGGDNQFKVVVNGSIVIDTGSSYSDKQFKIWHVIPVILLPGLNYFNCIATGDGSTSDSIAMVGYDNTAAEIIAAASDSNLNIMFKSSSLRGGHFDVATCAAGYSLDISGGSGYYICSQILTKVCNSSS